MDKTKNKIRVSLKWFYKSLWELVLDIFSVRHGADIEGTIEGIKKDIEFKGHNVWILMLSIVIASIGLNTNSVAIIIGAMLISPLMGPILGVGYGLGTNDINTIFISLKNILVAVIISILTSYVYFKLSPFTEEQPEILARTKPHLLDVLISIFGGLAGIIGNSRKERSNVIPGVAIATALMPPLCTAGYGLAMGHYDYFMGAFYLFLLNAAGISITTLVVVKYMKFPVVHFIDPKTEKRVKWAVTLFWMLLVIPSCFMFYKVLKEDVFKRKVNKFIANEINFNSTYLVKESYQFTDTTSVINLYFYGEIIDSTNQANLQQKLLSYELTDCKLVVHQDKNNSKEFQQKLSNVESSFDYMFNETNMALDFQRAKIDEIQQQLEKREDSINLRVLTKELHVLFPEIGKVGYANMEYPTGKADSIVKLPTFYVEKVGRRKKIDEKKLNEWLKLRSKLDTIHLIVN